MTRHARVSASLFVAVVVRIYEYVVMYVVIVCSWAGDIDGNHNKQHDVSIVVCCWPNGNLFDVGLFLYVPCACMYMSECFTCSRTAATDDDE